MLALETISSASLRCSRLASSWHQRALQSTFLSLEQRLTTLLLCNLALLRQVSEDGLCQASARGKWLCVDKICSLRTGAEARTSNTRRSCLGSSTAPLNALREPLAFASTVTIERGQDNCSFRRLSSPGTLKDCESFSATMVGRTSDGDAKRTFQIVVAATQELGIGKGGTLPWKLPGDMRFFKQVTSMTHSPDKQNAVVMGRRTWESIPSKFRPLPGRINVVLTRSASDGSAQTQYPGEVLVSTSLDHALSLLASKEHGGKVETVFVIGGGQVYREAMASPMCDAIHLTEVDDGKAPIKCDTFMPPVDMTQFRVWSASFPRTESGLRYSFVTYVRTPSAKTPPASEASTSKAGGTESVTSTCAEGHTEATGGAPCREIGGGGGREAEAGGEGSTDLVMEVRNGFKGAGASAVERLPRSILEKHEEHQYLNLIEEIIREGVHKGDRTGTGTISKFGCSMRFNLRKSFPLLTTKRVFWRGVVEELLWFVAGSTNAKLLQDKGVHIWDGNGSREYLDSIGLKDREEHDLGPVYGFQWRHFGAKYTDMHADYTGKGVDQLADLIHRIKTKPEDRRLILSAWNPADLKLMALPPCHMFCQFYVADGELSCQMYQRSCDMGLGVPFNIASYSLLTLMIAQVCGLRPGDFVHVLGDAHVYSNHVDPLQEQLRNTPRPFPVLKVNPDVKDIDSFTPADFELVGYEPNKRIAMKMAV